MEYMCILCILICQTYSNARPTRNSIRCPTITRSWRWIRRHKIVKTWVRIDFVVAKHMCADELIMLESVRHASNDIYIYIYIYIYMTSMWFNQHTCCKPQRKRIKRRVLQTYIYEYTFAKDCASRYPEGVHPNIREYSKNAYACTKGS
jgi:hypothetical protein